MGRVLFCDVSLVSFRSPLIAGQSLGLCVCASPLFGKLSDHHSPLFVFTTHGFLYDLGRQTFRQCLVSVGRRCFVVVNGCIYKPVGSWGKSFL